MPKVLTKPDRARVLWNAGVKTAATLAKKLGVTERTAYTYIKKLKNGVCLERKKRISKKTVITKELARRVVRIVKSNKTTPSLRDVASRVKVSHETVRTILHKEGIHYRRKSQKKLLTDDQKENRIIFAEQMIEEGRDWESVIFTDECSFWVNKCEPKYQWTDGISKPSGRGAHGPKVHIWGGISYNGALPLHIFKENLDGAHYIKILNKMIPEMEKLYPDEFTFQHDNAPPHRPAKTFIEENMPETLEWPAYSPDLSPIENIWAWLKSQVNKDRPQNEKALIRSIKKHWQKITPEFLEPYIGSMPGRMEMCIENEGEPINY